MTGVTYDCCQHCSCPETSDGHPTPCRTCAQPLRRTADQRAARAMAAADKAKR